MAKIIGSKVRRRGAQLFPFRRAAGSPKSELQTNPAPPSHPPPQAHTGLAVPAWLLATLGLIIMLVALAMM
jgi:hypothetical protein